MSPTDSPSMKERLLAAEAAGVLEELLADRIGADDGLWGVVADVTDGCRQGCLTCPAGRPSAAMDDETVAALGEVMVPHAEYLAIGCLGEPLLHPRLPEVLRTLRTIKDRVRADGFLCVLTAATPLSGGDLGDLAGSGMDILLVSADATDPDAYARVRGGAKWDDTRQRLDAAFPRLCEAGVRVGAQVMLLRCTASHARRTVEDLAAMGFTSITFTQPTRVPARAAGEVLRVDDPGFAAVEDLEAWVAGGEAGGPQISLPRRAPDLRGGLRARFGDGTTWDEDRLSGRCVCVAPWFNLRVDAAGAVFPCNFMDDPVDALGNVRDAGFSDLVAGPKARGIRETLLSGRAPTAACARCAFGPKVSF